MLTFNVGFSPETIRSAKNAIRRLPDIVRQEVVRSIDIALVAGKSVAVQEAPVAFGSVRRGINALLDPDNLRGTLISSAGHSAFVNFGTRPHFPPPSALEDWVRQKGLAAKLGTTVSGAAFVVARAIARRGTKAVPFFTHGGDAARETIRTELPAAGVRAARRMRSGG